MKLGDTVYVSSNMHRHRHGSAGWINSWVPFRVTAETRVSWVITPDDPSARYAEPKKVPKKDPFSKGIAPSLEAVKILAWDLRNRWRVCERARLAATTEQLRQIADLIKYTEPEGE